jgi:hypothetical protein
MMEVLAGFATDVHAVKRVQSHKQRRREGDPLNSDGRAACGCGC